MNDIDPSNELYDNTRKFPSVMAASFFMAVIFISFFAASFVMTIVVEGQGGYENLPASVFYAYQAIAEACYIGIPLLAVFFIYNKDRAYLFRLNPISIKQFLILIPLGFLIFYGNLVITMINYIAVTFFAIPKETFSPEIVTVADKLSFIIMLVIVAPVLEEFCMRGFLQRGFEGKSKTFSIIIVGVLFGMLHLSYYSLIPKILAGILFCYVVYITDSIYSGIILHMINNGVSGIMSICAPASSAEDEMSLSQIANSSAAEKLSMIIVYVFIAMFVFGIIFAMVMLLKNMSRKRNVDGELCFKGSTREKLMSEKPIRWYAYLPLIMTIILMTAFMAFDLISDII